MTHPGDHVDPADQDDDVTTLDGVLIRLSSWLAAVALEGATGGPTPPLRAEDPTAGAEAPIAELERAS